MFEFERFYNLAFNPFAKTVAAKDACATEDMRQVHARLDHLARTGGIGLVTADPGMGKTFAVRTWAARLNPNTARVVYTCLSTVSGVEFYRQLCLELGIAAPFKKVDMFRDLQACLRHLADEKRVRVTVVLDEAQYLSPQVLQDLKMLTNFDMDARPAALAPALRGAAPAHRRPLPDVGARRGRVRRLRAGDARQGRRRPGHLRRRGARVRARGLRRLGAPPELGRRELAHDRRAAAGPRGHGRDGALGGRAGVAVVTCPIDALPEFDCGHWDVYELCSLMRCPECTAEEGEGVFFEACGPPDRGKDGGCGYDDVAL